MDDGFDPVALDRVEDARQIQHVAARELELPYNVRHEAEVFGDVVADGRVAALQELADHHVPDGAGAARDQDPLARRHLPLPPVVLHLGHLYRARMNGGVKREVGGAPRLS